MCRKIDTAYKERDECKQCHDGGLDRNDGDETECVTLTKGSSITKKAAPLYTEFSNSYARLAFFLADPGPHNMQTNETAIGVSTKHISRFKKKAATWQLSKAVLYIASMNNNRFVDMYINLAEDERTAMAKAGPRNKGHLDKSSAKSTILQKGYAAG